MNACANSSAAAIGTKNNTKLRLLIQPEFLFLKAEVRAVEMDFSPRQKTEGIGHLAKGVRVTLTYSLKLFALDLWGRGWRSSATMSAVAADNSVK